MLLSALAVSPALDGDKVSHEAGDLALEEGVVAQDGIRVVTLGHVILGNNCKKMVKSFLMSFFPPFFEGFIQGKA